MKHQRQHSNKTQRVILAGLVSLSLAGCSVPYTITRSHGAGRAALLAKATELVSASDGKEVAQGSYNSAAIERLLESLTFAGTDVSISPDEVSIELRRGRVVICHESEISNWEDVTAIMQLESQRCIALSCALRGSNITGGRGGASTFKNVTWILSDGHGNNYFALVDGAGIPYTASKPLDLFPQAEGYLLSDTIYVAISRRLSGIPPRSGQAPCYINDELVVCEGWLSVPDEQWNVGMPETTETTDDNAYWTEEEVVLDSPVVWYEEFVDYGQPSAPQYDYGGGGGNNGGGNGGDNGGGNSDYSGNGDNGGDGGSYDGGGTDHSGGDSGGSDGGGYSDDDYSGEQDVIIIDDDQPSGGSSDSDSSGGSDDGGSSGGGEGEAIPAALVFAVDLTGEDSE